MDELKESYKVQMKKKLAAIRMSAADVGSRNNAPLVVVPVSITDHDGEAVSGGRLRVDGNGAYKQICFQ